MRLAFSTDTLARGGKERQMAILAKGLLALGHDLIFVAKRKDAGNNYFNEYQLNQNNINVYHTFREFSKIIAGFHPDVVLSWDAKSSVYNLLLYRRLNYVFINGSVRHGIRLNRLSHLFRSFVCRLSPYVMANSLAGLKANNLSPDKSHFILYNGVEGRFSNCLDEEEIKKRREMIIPGFIENPAPVYLSVANFVPYKDYGTVIKALAKMRDVRQFYYLIIGSGKLREEAETAIRANGLEKRVVIKEGVSDLKEYLFIADLFIHSSRGEGISNAILEAMQAGLPVIAANVGGVPETVWPGSSLLFSYGDVDALYRCLLESESLTGTAILSSPEYSVHLEKFSEENMISGFLEIITGILPGQQDN